MDNGESLTVLAANVGVVDAVLVGSLVVAEFSLLTEMTDPAFDPVFDFLATRSHTVVADAIQPSETKEGGWARVMHFALHDEDGSSDPFDDLPFRAGTH
ncbi:MAG: hypothetical protein J0I34_28980 [Pseudonocardia sp.]|uniref:hypothetical protein n=1 Tax=unclassified Pseudonocardia TaxID=2619320 RepID=UPI00086F9F4A|nr:MULTISPECIES: hypothetical protein [unclassified Pseudonocardia]MBN9112811.1 hypothetical protein [Pseudonocardia sp.]ODV00384.1 MAG: hypothetical protein ABT15_29745 [Pseudonocardia sp. SCN 73-27]